MRRMLFEDYRNMKDKMKPSLLTKRGEVVRVHKGSVIRLAGVWWMVMWFWRQKMTQKAKVSQRGL